ncbi:NAD(P)H-binding protein [Aureibacter tunicatorum]|uniref:Uncharacterized protein YbjT (DUF2867 family) n=1 Tax=Aureibacter tunicatorum TaxID=866807 RepID=A0AAE3XLA7_9BACT|nr:NAD(P)H-binding protein [Aureibacter tunicatorum]MDR6238967.1 uncharacterized protein YbjT (DUF2867 family) [Aureibacter tunicatorum]BDD05107.1 nucleoside-diphosphate sugar epimerase [Aureibacter tunicatorum]
MMPKSQKAALLAGATGLVGEHLLKLIIDDNAYDKVIVLSRKPLEISDDKLEVVMIDFDSLAQVELSSNIDEVFCCLGTTIKKAKTRDLFEKVDYEYCLELAKLGLKYKAGSFQLISAMGADEKSSFYYNKIKGKVEKAISELGYDKYSIIRPSLLMGQRSEERVGEDSAKFAMKAIGWLLIGKLKKYRGIEGEVVAKAMHKIASEGSMGESVYESDILMEKGEEK